MTWDQHIGDFITYLAASGSPASTRATRRQHLQQTGNALGGCPWALDAAALLAWFAERAWANETRRGHRNSLIAFYRWGRDHELTDIDVARLLPAVKPTPPAPQPVPDAAYAEALRVASPRVRLMIRLAAECGLRRAEVAQLHSRDLIDEGDGWALRVLGKGSKVRVVPLPVALTPDLRALDPGYFFPGDDGGHLSPRYVGILVSRALPAGWTMHKLRHRAATRWYAFEKDTLTVQDLLGHASPVTTRAYVKIPRDSLRRTVEAAA